MSFNLFSNGTYNTTPPTLSNGQVASVELDVNGNQKVAVQGTVPVSGTVAVSGTVPVSGTFWQSTQPISGSVSITGTPTVTVGNSSIAVTGTFYQTTQPISGSVSITGTPTVAVSGTVPVSGMFYQTTQPVSIASAITTKLQDGSGNAISSSSGSLNVNVTGGGSSGTQYAQATSNSTPTGTVAMGKNPSNVINALSLDASGYLLTNGSNATQPISGSVSITGTPTVSVSGTVPVSGTFWQSTQPISGSVSITGTPAVSISGTPTVTVGNSSLAVTGTFYQTTQPISGTVTSKLQDGSGNAIGSTSGALNVNISSGSSSGTQYAQSTSNSTPTGTVAMGLNGSGVLKALTLDSSGYLEVNVMTGGSVSSVKLEDGSGNAITSTSSALDVNIKSTTLVDPAESTTGTTAPSKFLFVGGKTNDATPQYQPIPLTASGASVKVDGSAVTQPVSGTFWQSTQPVSGTVAVTGTFWQSTQPVSVAGTITTTQTPATSGGLLTNVQQAITTSAQVKSSAGQLYGYAIFNPNTSTSYVFFYNTTSTPTIGSTTNLLFQIGIPAGAAANVPYDSGIAFASGLYVSVSSAATSSAAPSTGLTITVLYK